MILVRYTTQFLKLGYEFPCVKEFKTEQDIEKWKKEMKEKHGRFNFKVFEIWEHTKVKTMPFVDALSIGGCGGGKGCDRSTDACILGMDY